MKRVLSMQRSEKQREDLNASFTSNIDLKEILQMPRSSLDNNVHVGKDVYDDIEMIRPYREDDESNTTIYDVVNFTKLCGSEIYLKHILLHPSTNVKKLLKRSQILTNVEQHYDFINNRLHEMQQVESDVLWLFEDRDANITALYDMVYFRFWVTKRLNKIPSAVSLLNLYKMLLSPLIGILSPVMYFVIPYLVLTYKYKLNISFKTYLSLLFQSSKMLFEMNGWSARLQYSSYIFSLVFYFQGVFNSVEVSRTSYNVAKFITKRVENIIKFIDNGNDVLEISETLPIARNFFGVEDESLDLTRIQTPVIEGLDLGSKLTFFKTIDKTDLTKFITRAYQTDAIMSIIQYKKLYCLQYTSFVDGTSPLMEFNDFWHPCITTDKVVCNSIYLQQNSRNMIITGPNAGGKSTLVKAILINTLLAQTTTVAFCSNSRIKPFKFINSQINIPDCKGKESLFQAEMHRCKYNFDSFNELSTGDCALVLMDEILSSTNPLEGISGSYAILKKMATYTNCIVIFTTHFAYLTKLEKCSHSFLNYKMDVMINNGVFQFPYVMKRGISNQYIALDLLESEGFYSDIIQEAKTLRQRLSAFNEKRKDIHSVKK